MGHTEIDWKQFREEQAMIWKPVEEAMDGIMYLGWVNGPVISRYRFVVKVFCPTKRKPKRFLWRIEGGKRIPPGLIAGIAELPDPRDIGPYWNGRKMDV